MGSYRLLTLVFVLQLLWATSLFAEEKRFVAEIADGVQRVAVVGSEYAFTPDVITLKLNVPVEFRAKKQGGLCRTIWLSPRLKQV